MEIFSIVVLPIFLVVEFFILVYKENKSRRNKKDLSEFKRENKVRLENLKEIADNQLPAVCPKV